MAASNSRGEEMYILSPADIPPQAFSKMTTFGALHCCNFSLHDLRALIPSQPSDYSHLTIDIEFTNIHQHTELASRARNPVGFYLFWMDTNTMQSADVAMLSGSIYAVRNPVGPFVVQPDNGCP